MSLISIDNQLLPLWYGQILLLAHLWILSQKYNNCKQAGGESTLFCNCYWNLSLNSNHQWIYDDNKGLQKLMTCHFQKPANRAWFWFFHITKLIYDLFFIIFKFSLEYQTKKKHLKMFQFWIKFHKNCLFQDITFW